MLGLCGSCFASNIEVFIKSGRILCGGCKDARSLQEKEEEKVIKTDFDDITPPSAEERRALTHRNAKDIFEVIFHREMNRERVNEVL